MQTSDHAVQDTEVAPGMTEDQATEALLKKWGGTDDDGGDSSDDETTDEANDEQPDEGTDSADDEPGDEASESGEIEIDVAGEKFKMPAQLKEVAERVQAKAKEVEAGATRKFQEAAEARKAADLSVKKAQQQQHFNEAIAHLFGDRSMAQRRLAAIGQQDTRGWSADDVAQLNAEFNRLSLAEKRIEGEISRVQGLFETDQKNVETQRWQAAQEFAKAGIKDWTTGGDKRVGSYALNRGIAPDEMEALVMQNPRLLLILDDAEYGARVRSAAHGRDKRVPPASKTVKPGAGGQSKTTAASKADALTAKARKTGSVDDAVNALLARSQAAPRRRK